MREREIGRWGSVGERWSERGADGGAWERDGVR